MNSNLNIIDAHSSLNILIDGIDLKIFPGREVMVAGVLVDPNGGVKIPGRKITINPKAGNAPLSNIIIDSNNIVKLPDRKIIVKPGAASQNEEILIDEYNDISQCIYDPINRIKKGIIIKNKHIWNGECDYKNNTFNGIEILENNDVSIGFNDIRNKQFTGVGVFNNKEVRYGTITKTKYDGIIILPDKSVKISNDHFNPTKVDYISIKPNREIIKAKHNKSDNTFDGIHIHQNDMIKISADLNNNLVESVRIFPDHSITVGKFNESSTEFNGISVLSSGEIMKGLHHIIDNEAISLDGISIYPNDVIVRGKHNKRLLNEGIILTADNDFVDMESIFNLLSARYKVVRWLLHKHIFIFFIRWCITNNIKQLKIKHIKEYELYHNQHKDDQEFVEEGRYINNTRLYIEDVCLLLDQNVFPHLINWCSNIEDKLEYTHFRRFISWYKKNKYNLKPIAQKDVTESKVAEILASLDNSNSNSNINSNITNNDMGGDQVTNTNSNKRPRFELNSTMS